MVNIYVETDDRSSRKKERTVMYLLECYIRGAPFTRSLMFTSTGSLCECLLSGLIKALERVRKPSEITFFTSSSLILDMIEYHLPGWAERDFRKKDGNDIANRDMWMDFYERASKHEVGTRRGHHEYHNWMSEEMRRKKAEHDEAGTVQETPGDAMGHHQEQRPVGL